MRAHSDHLARTHTHLSVYTCYIFEGFISLRNSHNGGLGETTGTGEKEKRTRSNCRRRGRGKRGETEIKETRRIHTRKGHGNGRPVNI